MSMIEWAEKELAQLSEEPDEMQQMINHDILEIIKAFAAQGHSGFSAGYAVPIINRLLNWLPLKPLTGEDDEWLDVPAWDGRPGAQQNRRFFSVFREHHDNTTAYWSSGKVFSDNGGATWFTSKDSSVPVTFPFHVPDQPEHVYIEYVEPVPRGYSSDRYQIITDQPERIKELREAWEAEVTALQVDARNPQDPEVLKGLLMGKEVEHEHD